MNKKNIFLTGTAALALLFGMTFAGCDIGGDSDEKPNITATAKKIKVTGLGEYEGKSARVSLISSGSTVAVSDKKPISNGAVVLDLVTSSLSSWTGTGTHTVLFVIYDTDGSEICRGSKSQNITQETEPFTLSDFGVTVVQKITITGLTSYTTGYAAIMLFTTNGSNLTRVAGSPATGISSTGSVNLSLLKSTDGISPWSGTGSSYTALVIILNTSGVEISRGVKTDANITTTLAAADFAIKTANKIQFSGLSTYKNKYAEVYVYSASGYNIDSWVAVGPRAPISSTGTVTMSLLSTDGLTAWAERGSFYFGILIYATSTASSYFKLIPIGNALPIQSETTLISLTPGSNSNLAAPVAENAATALDLMTIDTLMGVSIDSAGLSASAFFGRD